MKCKGALLISRCHQVHQDGKQKWHSECFNPCFFFPPSFNLMAGNRRNEWKPGIVSPLKTYCSVVILKLLSLKSWIWACVVVCVWFHFRSLRHAQLDGLTTVRVHEPAFTCYTVTSGWTNPESWPSVESTDLLKSCQAEGMGGEGGLLVCVWGMCVCVRARHGTKTWWVVLPVQCVLVEIKIISNLCEWDLQGV